jgi:hypothetical protein
MLNHLQGLVAGDALDFLRGAANQTFAAVTLAPKTLGAFTDISRKLMAQSDPS